MAEALHSSSEPDAELTSVAAQREGTVMLADVIGMSRLYAGVGDLRAVETIARCRNVLREIVEAQGGRIVRTMGERLMALFRAGDMAALAATRMHLAVEAMPPHEDVKLAMRIAFSTGALIQRDDEVFGETVDITAGMLNQASKAQTLTSEATVETLGPIVRNCVRRFHAMNESDGTTRPIWELAWRRSPDITDVLSIPQMSRTSSVLRLFYHGQTVVRRRGNEALRVGRDDGCDVLVQDRKASRHHCTIERKAQGFVLRDHSTNGTYVTPKGESEVVLLGDELPLTGNGVITLGQARAQAVDVIEYSCEDGGS
jgi:adenylate cyclase